MSLRACAKAVSRRQSSRIESEMLKGQETTAFSHVSSLGILQRQSPLGIGSGIHQDQVEERI